ncbi:SMP-30/Gluconolactonase/LRE-like region [Macleaya cordata]|uniref:SMP-30/Gluconolactonase/LRE-like region n=1 Tax=Macleaya cordata TaxID=56857 RepID=A0A200R221_MACCD|nr:SMP-30/Gluconolactonase/LRE-like region [Macleaya cordata]
MAFLLCSPRCLLLVLIISAVPLGFIISLERSKSSTNVYEYSSPGWFRECSKWDDLNRRFLVSYIEGGVGQISVPEDHTPGTVIEAKTVIKESELAGNASLGMVIDRPRNRLLVVSADLKGNLFSAVAAYDLTSWNRLFLTQLSGPGDEKAFSDDVAVDEDGNAYITDAKASKIWKVGANGELLTIIKSPLFTFKEWYKNLVALNGIVYHPDGFLLVIHTFTGTLYKINPKTEEVKLVKLVGGSLAFGDGIELLSSTKLVVAGNPSGRLVESLDGWETATVVAKYSGPMHRLATSATVKDGKVYLNHMIGFGLPNTKHNIVEAVFKPVN